MNNRQLFFLFTFLTLNIFAFDAHEKKKFLKIIKEITRGRVDHNQGTFRLNTPFTALNIKKEDR